MMMMMIGGDDDDDDDDDDEVVMMIMIIVMLLLILVMSAILMMMMISYTHQDDALSIDEVVVTMEGGPYQEYFAIEIPIIIMASNRPSETVSQVPSSITAEGISKTTIGISETAIGVSETAIGISETAIGISETAISWVSRCSGHRRFVFLKEEQSASFPMQFGLEVMLVELV